MAETLVKEKVCRACGADVRPHALFCYNCGSAVAPDAPLIENNNKKNDDWFQNETSEEEFEKEDEVIVVEEPEEIGNSEALTEAEEEKKETRDLSKMDSAANLRRRGKSVQKKRVEIVWEEHDNAPNGWFIFFAVILTILAVAIWIVSTYLE
jgi:hypothetical protein